MTNEDADRGFSLVEVIVALGLLGGVLLSILTLFVLASRQVTSARTMTEATALASDILESFKTRSFVGLWTVLDAAPGDTRATSSTLGHEGVLAAWQPRIAGLPGEGSATLTLEPIGPGTSGFGAAHGIRLIVHVTWGEAGRRRGVTLVTARF